MNSLKQFGFSLVEVMVAMGMLGAGALAYMQINKTNIQANKKTEIRYDVDNLAKEISNVLMSEGACSQTFSGKSFSANGTFSSVRDDRGQIVYRTGEVIPNSVNIVSFNYEVIRTPVAGSQVGEFRISF